MAKCKALTGSAVKGLISEATLMTRCVYVFMLSDGCYEAAVTKLESARIEWEVRMQDFCKVCFILRASSRHARQTRRAVVKVGVGGGSTGN